jgi:hypothetical protein
MIPAGTLLSAAWLRLDRIVVGQYEERNIDQVAFYTDLMHALPGEHAGPPITVAPLGDGRYAILDGHHRFMAHIITGKECAPCVIVGE